VTHDVIIVATCTAALPMREAMMEQMITRKGIINKIDRHAKMGVIRFQPGNAGAQTPSNSGDGRGY
jgi:hypothetical protein